MKNEKFLEDKIKKVTEAEVQELFETEFSVDIKNYAWYNIPYRNYENDNYTVQKEVDSYGGEGQGEEYWKISRVLHKKTGEVFFIRFDAYYSSWEGAEWSENDWVIVEPKEVKVVQWC